MAYKIELLLLAMYCFVACAQDESSMARRDLDMSSTPDTEEYNRVRDIGSEVNRDSMVDQGVREASCVDPEVECTLRQVSNEVGTFIGTTSYRPSWTEGELGALINTHFSSITSENELKWRHLVREPGLYDFVDADETIDFAEERSLRTRGHTLFWHRLNGIPHWLSTELAVSDNPELRLRELMHEHVSTVVGRYAGRIESWDVVNEPLAIFGAEPDPDSIFFQTFERTF